MRLFKLGLPRGRLRSSECDVSIDLGSDLGGAGREPINSRCEMVRLLVTVHCTHSKEQGPVGLQGLPHYSV